MRLTLAIVVAVTLASGLASGTPSARGQLRPVLRLTERGVTGLNFAARERVRVVAVGAARVTKNVRADRLGRFVVSFAGTSSCAGFSVIATGSDGSRATFKRPPGQCPAT
jgi:hypothetical protein